MRTFVRVALGAFALATLTPRETYAAPDDKTFAGVVGGAAFIVLGWAPVAAGAGVYEATRDANGKSAWPLFVPVAGPFVQLGRTSPDAAGVLLLGADGVLQALGLLVLVAAVAEYATPEPKVPTCYERPPTEGPCTGDLPPPTWQYPPRERPRRSSDGATFVPTASGFAITF